jgi:hypothetical protein
MIKKVNLSQLDTSFRSKQSKKDKKADDETRLLPNNLQTRVRQSYQKTTSAFLDYPARGLTGDVNSNFYEFLTMGAVPYITGSAMFMYVFNCLNNKILPHGASTWGKKMALGVGLYGIGKTLAKDLVTTPVKYATGVDTEMPYQNKVYNLPKEAGDAASIDVQYQHRTVFDSNEFYRKDLLPREYFAKIAAKNGLGENLNDPVTEAGPIIQNIVSTSNLAKSMASYAWGAVGIMLAVQNPWSNFFDSISNRKHYVPKEGEGLASKLGGRMKTSWNNTVDITKTFGKSFARSCKTLWNGAEGTSGFRRYAGKSFVLGAAAITTLLTANTIMRAKNMAKNLNQNTIDKTKESTVI